MLLNSRVQRLVIPIMDYKIYIDYRQPVLSPGSGILDNGGQPNALKEGRP
jgi:hypothetical protein